MGAVLKEQVEVYRQRYRHNPALWASELANIYLWSKQREIIQSVFENPKTVVRASYSVGKTFVAAVASLAFMYVRSPAKVITSAPTGYQVKDLLWAEMNHIFGSKLKGKCPGTMLTTRLSIRPDWFALGISPREEVNFQGFHQRNVLVVLDEMPGVRKEVVDGSDSLLSSGDAHCLWIGNPIEESGPFYHAFRDPSFAKFHISAFDTPSFTGEDVPESVREALVSPTWVEEKRNLWGEDSALWKSKVLGEFPEGGTNQVIPLALCEAAKNREIEAEGDKILGVDPARFGDDFTSYTECQGDVINWIDVESKKDNMEVAGRAAFLHGNNGYATINVDVIGLGSGVVDRLRELKMPVAGINVAEAAISKDLYFNKRTEVWFNMADWLKTGKIPDDDELIADLTAPRYTYTSKGQYKLESKDETKKRLGRSPDRGDSAVLATMQPRYAKFNELMKEVKTRGNNNAGRRTSTAQEAYQTSKKATKSLLKSRRTTSRDRPS